jgi:hypothetical protein
MVKSKLFKRIGISKIKFSKITFPDFLKAIKARYKGITTSKETTL